MGEKKLKSFVFNCILAENDLKSLEEQGINVKKQNDNEEIIRVVEDDFSPRIWFDANKMGSIYKALFCIENTVRNFIVERLAERRGSGWWDECVPKKIKDEVEKLKNQEQKNKYLEARSQTDIGYTMLGNLAQIIINKWNEFSDIIPDQAWLNSRMTDLEKCRNVIMHTGTLDDYEIERIESIIRDIMRQIG